MFGNKNKSICQTSDENLMKKIQYNNTEAFNELYNRYQKRILYYFYRMLGNDKDIAQDFLQELFYKVIDKSSLYDPTKKFSTWIFSVAHNMCKNEYRKREVRKMVVNKEDLDHLCYEEPVKQRNEISADIIFRELDSLEESNRTAFILKYREGFSVEEIGDILNLPTGTVKSRLYYARKKLQEKLKQFEILNT